MHARTTLAAIAILLTLSACGDDGEGKFVPPALRVGVAAVPLTPCGANPDWDGPITASGVWGEQFTDEDGNGHWDPGEPFVDDPVNDNLDDGSVTKYDGIFLAGFGNNRIATGCHDDIWARAVVLQTAEHKVALVSVDFVGQVSHGTYFGFAHAQKLVDPGLGIDTFIFSSTHDHEAPDTLGLWGESEFVDGKFPRYLQFVDRQIARAIEAAAAPAGLRAASVIAAQVTPDTAPDLRGLQVRTRCRPPFFFDDELRALQFVANDGSTIATLINWSTHPESLESENTQVSSDFPNYIRRQVESTLGGTAVYFSGDLGAVEIVGDSCRGGADPHADDGSNEFDQPSDLGFPRTQRIGELVGGVVIDALRHGQTVAAARLDAGSTLLHLPGTNVALSLASSAGLLDLDPDVFDVRQCPPGTAICIPVEQQMLTLADAANQPLVQFMTAPGELFPELFYGTERFHRTDCPAADRGLSYEPSVRDRMTAPYRFLIGLSPDEFGYIVPGYDFFPAPAPFEEAKDPCDGQHFDPQFPRRQVPTHYHETLSVGANMAAATTCNALRLLGLADQVNANAACQRVFGTK